jgi:hypothetical protein
MARSVFHLPAEIFCAGQCVTGACRPDVPPAASDGELGWGKIAVLRDKPVLLLAHFCGRLAAFVSSFDLKAPLNRATGEMNHASS